MSENADLTYYQKHWDEYKIEKKIIMKIIKRD